MKVLYKYMFFLLPVVLSAQNPIPNSGFENWNNGEPSGWYTNNIPTVFSSITQSGTANTGSSALKCEILNVQGNPYPGFVIAGTVVDPYIPVSQNYEKLSGYYQLQTTKSDFILIFANLFDADKALIASITGALETVTDQYSQFSFDFDYSFSNGNDVAFMLLQFVISSGSPDSMQIGSYFLIDDLELSGVTAIKPINEIVPNQFTLSQNYPNPFNPVTTIEFSTPKSQHVHLDVFNLLGEKVADIVNERLEAGNYSLKWDAGNLPGGTYFYRLVAGGKTKIRKLIVLK